MDDRERLQRELDGLEREYFWFMLFVLIVLAGWFLEAAH